MGCGCTFTCNKCNKNYNISLGEGMLSFFLDSKNILYSCPNCGNWETRTVDYREYSSPEFRKESKEMLKKDSGDDFKEIIDNVEQVDHNKKCTTCGSIMKIYEDIKFNNNSYSPTLVCKNCKSKLFYKSSYCWD